MEDLYGRLLVFDPTPDGWAAFREAQRRARAAAEADPEGWRVSFPVMGTADYHLRLPEGCARIAGLRFPDGETAEFTLEDGRRVVVPLSWFPILRDALPEERAETVPIEHGAGLHFPALNAEVAVDHVLFCRSSAREWSRVAQEVTPQGLILVIEALIKRWLLENGGATKKQNLSAEYVEVDPAALDRLFSMLREMMSSLSLNDQAKGDRIVENIEMRFSKPRVEGTWITVSDILGWLAGGMSEDAILAEHTCLTREDIREALAYAARCLDSPFPSRLPAPGAREGPHVSLLVAAWEWLREQGGTDHPGGDERPWLHRPTRQGILALREYFETKVLAELAVDTTGLFFPVLS